MAENVLSTRILLRYDTYFHWMNSGAILKPGEAAIAAFPDENENRPPKAVGIKIGDGLHYFYELPWIQAIAADVYNWAKAADKPTYTANEISGLEEYIEAHGGGGSGSGSGISGSAYQIIYDENSSKYILQYYDDEDETWKNTSSEINMSGVLSRLTSLERWANGERTGLGTLEFPLTTYIYDEVVTYLNRLDVPDLAVQHQFVTSVVQTNGKIEVSRSVISASDISGVFSTAQGGTGLTEVESDQVLVGSNNGTITTKTFVTTITADDTTSFATTGAIMNYVRQATAGLTGAMHFIGDATVVIDSGPNSRVDPQVYGYDFRNVQPGDVILANNAQEYVWSGSEWRLLGDEGSYAVKGSITDADIADGADISQTKIAGLSDTFDTKVDKVSGKDLSSNDYTDEDKEKLELIENGAQANVIEHVFLNDVEVTPTVVDGQAKSVNLQFNGMSVEQGEKLAGIEAGAQVNAIEHVQLNGTEITPENKTVNIELNEFTTQEKEKLTAIEAEAQVNKIEKIIYDGNELAIDDKTVSITSDPHTEHINKIEQIFINGTEWTPNAQKQVRITIDQAALNLNVLEGAQIPGPNGTTVEVEQVAKKLQLEKIAVSGDVKDLKQTADTYIILDCGSSTTVV